MTEARLLAALIYSESSASINSFEEKAAIGKTALKIRDAWNKGTLNQGKRLMNIKMLSKEQKNANNETTILMVCTDNKYL